MSRHNIPKTDQTFNHEITNEAIERAKHSIASLIEFARRQYQLLPVEEKQRADRLNQQLRELDGFKNMKS